MSILYFVLGSGLLYFFSAKKSKHLARWSVVLFAVKVLVGGIFYYVYAYFYSNGTLSGDTSVYHQDSMVLFELLEQDSSLFWKVIFGQDSGVQELNQFYLDTHYWEFSSDGFLNDSRNFVRINALLAFIGRGYYFVHTILLCLISTFGFVLFYRGLLRFMKEAKLRITLIVFFIPSMVFWTSGLMKETVLTFGMGLLLNAFLCIAKKENNWKTVLKLLLGIAVMYCVKQYVLIAFILPAICFSICLWKENWSKIKVYGAAVFILFLTFVFWDKPVDALSAKQSDFISISKGEIVLDDEADSTYYYFSESQRELIAFEDGEAKILETISGEKRKYFTKERIPIELKASEKTYLVEWKNKKSGSYFEMAPIDGSKWVMFKNLPFGINNVIFRPFPWEGSFHIFKLMAFLEYATFFLLILFAWRNRVKYQDRTIKNIVSFFLFVVTLLYALIGQVTPVSGAISRYKVPGLMILAGVIVLLMFGYSKENEERKERENLV